MMTLVDRAYCQAHGWGPNPCRECLAGDKPKFDAVHALDEALHGTPTNGDGTAEPHHAVARDGATFILDEPAELEARWGKGSDVLWARGESLMIVGPPGVGKTTIAGQLIGALLGLWEDVLGYPVTPATKVLYLAMDRPRQVRRAMRRLFGEEHRQALAERLVVRPGPIPADLGKNPDTLLDLAYAHSSDVVIVDSLKDAAVKLSDDETGGNVNRAIQACNAVDVDTVILHHQRKGVGGDKPTSLEDVYGNTWLSAGAGSVVLLWGDAGSELVELTHLKQPADPVGPLTVEHDHHRGTSIITRGFDALAFLRGRGDTGATVADAALAEHGSAQKPSGAKWKQTERRLRSLARAGLASSSSQDRGGGGQFATVRYWAVDIEHMRDFTVDTHRGQGGSDTAVDTTVDTTVDNRGQETQNPRSDRGHHRGHASADPHRGQSPGDYVLPDCPKGAESDGRHPAVKAVEDAAPYNQKPDPYDEDF